MGTLRPACYIAMARRREEAPRLLLVRFCALLLFNICVFLAAYVSESYLVFSRLLKLAIARFRCLLFSSNTGTLKWFLNVRILPYDRLLALIEEVAQGVLELIKLPRLALKAIA